MVLIIKWGGDYHGIGLVEVIWKVVVVILNRSFTAAIPYHGSLYRFWLGRGTATATLEVKLLQKIAALREPVLHAIFLNLHKVYNALDMYICMGIL